MAYYEVTLRREDDVALSKVLHYEAPSGDVVRQSASKAQKGWVITSLSTVTERPDSLIKARVKKMGGKALVRMCRSMGSLLNAKIGMEDTLMFYCNGLEDKELREALSGIRERLKEGVSADEAFAASGRFDAMLVGLIKAGSQSGMLGDSFRAVADRVQTTLNFQKKLKKALYTPCFVLLGIFNIFIFSQTTLTPQVENMMRDVGAKPDDFSALIFGLSHITKAVWPFAYLLLIAVGATLFFSAHIRELLITICIARWKVAREMVMGLRQLLILGTMGLIVRNGGSVIESLACAAKVVEGTAMERELKEVSGRYQQGFALSEGFRRFTSCDKPVAHMLGAGEKGGTLPEQLHLLAEMYEEQTADSMEIFVAVTSFITLFICCALIGFVFLGSILPTILMGPRMMNALH